MTWDAEAGLETDRDMTIRATSPLTSKLLSPSAKDVAVCAGPTSYQAPPPFAPGVEWPEYRRICHARAHGPVNEVYSTVRDVLRALELDPLHEGTADWNPLGEIIGPGDTVVIKPNLVRDFRERSADHADCLIAHGAVIRAVLDYAYLALQGKGRLVIADAPHNDADFEGVRRIAALDAIVEFYRRDVGFEVEVYDLRPEAARKIDGVIVGHVPLSGDPAGYVKVDLGAHSAFEEIGDLCQKLYGSEYDRRELVSHHTHGVHEYLLSGTVLQADCVISLPKLKTHKKTGLTANMKNLVGINGNKNWLPHHREGTPADGGDQFADSSVLRRLERASVEAFKRSFPYLGPLRQTLAGPLKAVGKGVFGDTNAGTIRSGNWYGNDTTWRMVLDLNRMLFYADASGRLHDQPVRRFFSIVDGIIGGEGNGPLDPTPKRAGVVVGGWNPVAVDLACARVMGFDYRKIPMLARAFDPSGLKLMSFSYDELTAHRADGTPSEHLNDVKGRCSAFEPHFGWKGHIELAEQECEESVLA